VFFTYFCFPNQKVVQFLLSQLKYRARAYDAALTYTLATGQPGCLHN